MSTYDDRYERKAVKRLNSRQRDHYRRLQKTNVRGTRTKFAFPATTILVADTVGINLSLALAFLDQETGGGYNVFGHDPTIFIGAGQVTRAKYLAYKIRRGLTGKYQGVGPMQLTWIGYQKQAEAAGGCWKANVSMRVGLRTVQANIRAHGERDGIRAYNGTGPAAVSYANSITDKSQYYHHVL